MTHGKMPVELSPLCFQLAICPEDPKDHPLKPLKHTTATRHIMENPLHYVTGKRQGK